MEIKKRFGKEKLNDFAASNGWLENWKKMYALREKRLCGEVDDAATTIIQAWRERLSELCYGYEPQKYTEPRRTFKNEKKQNKGGKKSR